MKVGLIRPYCEILLFYRQQLQFFYRFASCKEDTSAFNNYKLYNSTITIYPLCQISRIYILRNRNDPITLCNQDNTLRIDTAVMKNVLHIWPITAFLFEGLAVIQDVP